MVERRLTEGEDLCGNRIYGAFVLNRRVDLHAIDATPARWRGDVGSSPLDGPSAVAPNALVNFHTGEDHHVVVVKITDASVREDYWDGKTFRAPHGRAPFLSFLGSQSFGHTVQS